MAVSGEVQQPMELDAASVLGVRRDASAAEIREAYRNRARLLHPDRHVDADPATTRSAVQAMAQLNYAYEQMLEVVRSAASDPAETKAPPVTPIWTSASPKPRPTPSPSTKPLDADPSSCEFCGCGPAIDQTLRECVGMLVVFSWRTYEVRACRTCGTAIAEDSLNSTMVKGWWGVFAVVANLWAITCNVTARQAFGALPTPPLGGGQLAPGAPLLRRPGLWVTAAVVVWFAVSLATAP
jgi:hypothetical protein